VVANLAARCPSCTSTCIVNILLYSTEKKQSCPVFLDCSLNAYKVDSEASWHESSLKFARVSILNLSVELNGHWLMFVPKIAAVGAEVGWC
jgi:hypothetical protein